MMPSSNSSRSSYSSTGAAWGMTAAALQPLLGLAAQLLDLVVGEARQDRVALADLEGAAAGDLDRVLQRLGQVGEKRRHLGRRT